VHVVKHDEVHRATFRKYLPAWKGKSLNGGARGLKVESAENEKAVHLRIDGSNVNCHRIDGELTSASLER